MPDRAKEEVQSLNKHTLDPVSASDPTLAVERLGEPEGPSAFASERTCYRCRENPQWRGFAWCLQCSIKGAHEALDHIYGPRDYARLGELVSAFGKYPEFTAGLIAAMQKRLQQHADWLKEQRCRQERQKQNRRGYPFRSNQPLRGALNAR
jgi:hypothetical protein